MRLRDASKRILNGNHEALTRAGERRYASPPRSWLVAWLLVCAVVGGALLSRIGHEVPVGLRWGLVAGYVGVIGGAAVALILIRSELVLSPTTIEVRFRRHTRTYELARCSSFEVWSAPWQPTLVVFDYPDDSARRMARANRVASGHTSSFGTYDIGATRLAAILNEARQRALRPTTPYSA